MKFTSRKMKNGLVLTVGIFSVSLVLLWMSSSGGVWSVSKKSTDADDENFVMSDNIRIPLVSVAERNDFMSRVVYNRVGKCGSRTMQNIIRILAKQNSYNFYLSTISNDTRPKTATLIKEVKLISTLASPMLYSRHIHFINFPKFGVRKPVYINMVRDPIERFSSQYHFKRYGDMIESKGRQSTFKSGEKTLDINDCILRNHSECMPPKLWYVIPYFCGQAAFCRIPSVEALRRAKMNVVDSYLSVGVLEDFEGTLKVFEKLLPTHFGGATEAYNELLQDSTRKNTSTVGKKQISPEAYTVLRKRMELDYEFYDFVTAMFKITKKKLNLV